MESRRFAFFFVVARLVMVTSGYLVLLGIRTPLLPSSGQCPQVGFSRWPMAIRLKPVTLLRIKAWLIDENL